MSNVDRVCTTHFICDCQAAQLEILKRVAVLAERVSALIENIGSWQESTMFAPETGSAWNLSVDEDLLWEEETEKLYKAIGELGSIFENAICVDKEIDRLRASIDSIRATTDRDRTDLFKENERLRDENRQLLQRTSPATEPCSCPEFCSYHARSRFDKLVAENAMLKERLECSQCDEKKPVWVVCGKCWNDLEKKVMKY